MTICIAIKTIEGHIVGFTDRLYTTDEKSWEGISFCKIHQITPSIVIIASGNASMIYEVIEEFKLKIENQVTVKELGYLYTKVYKDIKLKKEALYKDLVEDYKFDRISAIICGIDTYGSHIYILPKSGDIMCYSGLGLCTIGSGSTHSDLYLYSKENRMNLKEACFEGYRAKKLSEQESGVGKATDMFIIKYLSPETDCSNSMIEKLDEIYNIYVNKEKALHEDILKLVNESLTLPQI